MRTLCFSVVLLLGAAAPAHGQEPICIVDGKVVDCSSMGTLDPNRIETMSIRKGKAAVHLYGEQAANGVIDITTKEEGRVAEALANDPIARHLFAPELIMSNQQAIGLTERQRSAIQSAMREAQSRFVDLQFDLNREMEQLQTLLASTAPEEATVLRQLDRVLSLERELKRAQLGLMVRIKSQLTEAQQEQLRRLRR